MSAKAIIKGSLYRVGTKGWHVDVIASSSWEALSIGMAMVASK